MTPALPGAAEILPPGLLSGGGLLAAERTIEVAVPFAPLLPGGLRRGSVVEIAGVAAAGTGTTSLLFALLAAATEAGSWVAVVGAPGANPEAAALYGVHLERVAWIPRPGRTWPEVTAALLDALDVVALVPPGRARPTDGRRLAARARERGSVLVVVPPWPEPADLRLAVERARWEGLGAGSGTLGERYGEVVATGRRTALRPRRTGMWLPPAVASGTAGEA